MCCTLLNLIPMCSLHELFGVRHAHFRANFPFAKSCQMKNVLFRVSSSRKNWRKNVFSLIWIPHLLLHVDAIYILLAFSWWSYFRCKTYTFGCRSPRVTSTPAALPKTAMLILSLGFWRRADSTCFVSRSAAVIFHSPEIKNDITDFSNVSCYSIYKYFGDNHYIFYTCNCSLSYIFTLCNFYLTWHKGHELWNKYAIVGLV